MSYYAKERVNKAQDCLRCEPVSGQPNTDSLKMSLPEDSSRKELF